MEYVRLLAQNPNLSIDDVIMLDKIQKNREITEEEFSYLRKNKFIEGRKPKIYLSYKVIKPTENEELMADYVKNKSFDDDYFKKLITEYIKKQGKTSRKAIDKLIIPKLSEVLTEEQKKKKVTNFLSGLRIQGKIKKLPGYFWEII